MFWKKNKQPQLLKMEGKPPVPPPQYQQPPPAPPSFPVEKYTIDDAIAAMELLNERILVISENQLHISNQLASLLEKAEKNKI